MVIVQQWKIKHLYSSRHWMDDPELKLLGCLVLRKCSIVFFPHFDFTLSAPLKGGIPGLLENSTLEWTYAHFLTGNYLLFPRLWAHILLFILQVNINNSTNFNGLNLSIASNTILYEINGKWMLSVMLEEQCLNICTSCFLREVNDISQNNFSHLLFFFPCLPHCFSHFRTINLYKCKQWKWGDHVGARCWNLCITGTSKVMFSSESYKLWKWSLKRTNHLPFRMNFLIENID